jgi:succinoglycan biosynthesis transport protein ExoP
LASWVRGGLAGFAQMNGYRSTGSAPRDERADDPVGDASRAHDHLGVVRRLRVPLVVLLIGLPAVAFAFSAGKQNVYRATAEVLLSYQNFASSLTGATPSTVNPDPPRVAETQSRLARTPLVAQRALRVAGVRDESPLTFLDNSSARAEPNADLLVFQAEDTDPERAARLATAYARAYTTVSRELATAAIERARQGALRRIRALEQARDTRSRLYDSLIANEQQLSAMRALQTSNAALIRPAVDAVRIAPRPARDAVLGFALAIVLAACAVALAHAFDTRVRESDEAGRVLGLPLLARIPARPSLWQENRLPMLTEPNSRRAQPYRMLKTTFEFQAFAAEAQAVMVTSAGRGEAKSTTAANLALALARAGRRVVLVDFDMREPSLHRLFSRERAPGLSDVLTGRIRLEDALVEIEMPGRGPGRPVTWDRQSDGTLEVLSAGRPLEGRGAARGEDLDVAEAAGSMAFDMVLRRLRVTADVIVFDTPPVLRASEALALTRKVDGVLLTVSSEATRRAALHDLRRLLDGCPAALLGFVFIGPGASLSYGSTPPDDLLGWIPVRQHSVR